jgi:hypothetical protein
MAARAERNDCVDAPYRHQSFHSVVTQSVFGKVLFECDQLDGDPIVLIKMATNLPPLILRKRLDVPVRMVAPPPQRSRAAARSPSVQCSIKHIR